MKIIDQVLQKNFKNLHGRSAILDCVAIDDEGHQYNVEIQQDSEGASPKDDTELGRLMHDFNCKNPEEMYNEVLANRVHELKTIQETSYEKSSIN